MTAPTTTPATSAGISQPSKTGPLLSLRNLAKNFGKLRVLHNISLDIAQGEFLTILGESGSGKTTLLRLIAGFERADSGEIWMSGERLDPLPPYRRRVNTVFQHYALFPHLSVRENVAYGLRVKKIPPAEISPRVSEALAMVKMTSFAASKPANISGGQQQRVALARALVNQPCLLLLDEPLSALDANLRRQMQLELKSLQRDVGISFVFVTHDQEEAMVMSDRIALLRNGSLEQVATPREIYSRPTTAYAAQFIGHTNLLLCRLEGGIARCRGLEFPSSGPDGPAMFSLRPEHIRLAPSIAPAPGVIRFCANILTQSFHGSMDLLQVECFDGLNLLVRTSGHGALTGSREFEFSPAEAIAVRDSQEHA
jgi:ABC-type Fe3+/spermidine/putrescine transport system ATPase subunit